MPDMLTTGIMNLLIKSEDTKEPKNYLPITYLSSMNKMVIGIIARRISSRVKEYSLLPAEQKTSLWK